MENEIVSSVSPNKSITSTSNISKTISIIFNDSTSTQITNTNQQTSSSLNVIKQESAATTVSQDDKSTQLLTLSSSQKQCSSENNEYTQDSEAQSESQNNTLFGYFWKLFESNDSVDTENSNRSVETDSSISPPNPDSTCKKTIEETEVFIKATEPATNSSILDTEQIVTPNLIYLEKINTPENNITQKSSMNEFARCQKTQPIPTITPSSIEAQENIECITELEMSSILPTTASLSQDQLYNGNNTNTKAANVSQSEVEIQNRDLTFSNQITKVEQQKTPLNISSIIENATSNQKYKTLTIAGDKIFKESLQTTANTFLYNRHSDDFMKMIEEHEILIKASEPASNSLVLNSENTSEDHGSYNSSNNTFSKNKETQHIPTITLLNLEPLENSEYTIGVQTTQSIASPNVLLSQDEIDDENNMKAVRDSNSEVKKQIEEPTYRNTITQAMISSHSNTEHNEEYHEMQPVISGKQENAISNQNSKTQTILLGEKDTQETTANTYKFNKNSDNFEAKFTISFQFPKDQGTEHLQKDSYTKSNDTQSDILNEIAIKSVDLNVTASNSVNTPVSLITKLSFMNESQSANVPFIVLKSPLPSRFSQLAMTTQPFRAFTSIPSLISPVSFVTTIPSQPMSLFLQALAKLNESSISVAVFDNSGKENAETSAAMANTINIVPIGKMESTLSELSPPDSLTCAPPSYSFVLRQSARRRPRLMGTFVPSPSFVRKTPPPTYAAAFDIFIDSPIPPPPNRVYNYGFTEMVVVCPECGYAGITVIVSKVTFCTHLCALLLCIFCCWFCAPLPYVMRSCKDVYHYCRNCRNLLGVYRPYNPESPYPTVT